VFLRISKYYGQIQTQGQKLNGKRCTLEKNVINSFSVFRKLFLYKVASKIIFEQKNIFATSDKKSKQV
jgi:hypothetical protein